MSHFMCFLLVEHLQSKIPMKLVLFIGTWCLDQELLEVNVGFLFVHPLLIVFSYMNIGKKVEIVHPFVTLRLLKAFIELAFESF